MIVPPNPDPNTYIPSTPDPSKVLVVAGIIRALLAALAGAGIYSGDLGDSEIQMLAGAAVTLCMIAWSVHDHVRAARKDHEGSVRSSMSATPVRAV